tara:strand:+ start:451 stop:678 length:228 start_codon:yes stop_codon:yes gene_type:complete
MLKTRLIPVLLLKDGFIVKSINFEKYQSTGNPFEEVERFNQWQVDELIYLNISKKKMNFILETIVILRIRFHILS